MKFKQHLKNFFNFSHGERWGIFAIILFIFGMFFYGDVIDFFNKKNSEIRKTITAEEQSAMNSLADSTNKKEKKYYSDADTSALYSVPNKIEAFYFDPNVASEEDFFKLGLNKKQIHTIKNYVSKGGKFKKKADLKKIWGLQEEWYSQIEDYILLPDSFTRKKFEKKEYQKNVFAVIDINTADSETLEKLPGIGSYMAGKIEKYRKSLGGFYSIDQLKEMKNFHEEGFEMYKDKIKISSPHEKIDINSATKDELKNHPYIRWKLAEQIANYRKQHGNFADATELKKLPAMKDSIYNKLLPYIYIK